MKKNGFLAKIAPYFKTFSSADSIEIDYFIQCKHEISYQKLTPSLLKNIGTWSRYGNMGFRGWSALKKEEIVAYIHQETDLKEDELMLLKPIILYL